MKYLKYINESNFYNKEILDFCETHLAYLLDKGYRVDGFNSLTRATTFIEIRKESVEDTFTWNEVKDYLIPFLTHLDREFSLVRHSDYSFATLEFYFYGEKVNDSVIHSTFKTKGTTIERAISDDLPFRIGIGYIERITFSVEE